MSVPVTASPPAAVCRSPPSETEWKEYIRHLGHEKLRNATIVKECRSHRAEFERQLAQQPPPPALTHSQRQFVDKQLHQVEEWEQKQAEYLEARDKFGQFDRTTPGMEEGKGMLKQLDHPNRPTHVTWAAFMARFPDFPALPPPLAPAAAAAAAALAGAAAAVAADKRPPLAVPSAAEDVPPSGARRVPARHAPWQAAAEEEEDEGRADATPWAPRAARPSAPPPLKRGRVAEGHDEAADHQRRLRLLTPSPERQPPRQAHAAAATAAAPTAAERAAAAQAALDDQHATRCFLDFTLVAMDALLEHSLRTQGDTAQQQQWAAARREALHRVITQLKYLQHSRATIALPPQMRAALMEVSEGRTQGVRELAEQSVRDSGGYSQRGGRGRGPAAAFVVHGDGYAAPGGGRAVSARPPRRGEAGGGGSGGGGGGRGRGRGGSRNSVDGGNGGGGSGGNHGAPMPKAHAAFMSHDPQTPPRRAQTPPSAALLMPPGCTPEDQLWYTNAKDVLPGPHSLVQLGRWQQLMSMKPEHSKVYAQFINAKVWRDDIAGVPMTTLLDCLQFS